MELTCGIDRGAVEAGVLVYCRARKCIAKLMQRLGKRRSAFDGACTDPVQVGEGPLIHLRIDVGHPCFNRIVGSDAGHADLADAAARIVRGLDIEGKKAERACREGLNACLSDFGRFAKVAAGALIFEATFSGRSTSSGACI